MSFLAIGRSEEEELSNLILFPPITTLLNYLIVPILSLGWGVAFLPYRKLGQWILTTVDEWVGFPFAIFLN